MGFREQLNRKPTLSAGVVFGLLALLAVWALVVRLTNRASLQAGGEIYFSTNDGKTWFANPAMNQPPFDYDGATAVRCYVFRVGDSASFVGYLETNTPQMYDLLTGVSHGPGALPAGGTLVKKPGAGTWVPAMSPAGMKITNVTDPAGSGEEPQPVLPE